MWASGSHVCTGHTGSFIAKATTKNQNTIEIGMKVLAATPLMPIVDNAAMSETPVPSITASMDTSMKALPNMVNIRNFMAEYSLRPDPQMEMSMKHREQLQLPGRGRRG